MSDKCKKCEDNGEFKQTIKDFNNLVTEHNILVSKHKKLVDDANALMRMLEDVSLGIRTNIAAIVGPDGTYEDHLFDLNLGIWTEKERNYAELHNEIYNFVQRIAAGESASVVYNEFRQQCIEIHKWQSKRGGKM